MTPNQLLTQLKSNYGLDGVILPFDPVNNINDKRNVDDDGDIPTKIKHPDIGFPLIGFIEHLINLIYYLNLIKIELFVN